MTEARPQHDLEPSGHAQANELRVLVLTHSSRLGGAELALIRLCEALPQRVTVMVIAFEEGELVARLRALGISVEVVPANARWNRRGRKDNRSLGAILSMLADTTTHAVRVALRVRRLNPDMLQSWTLKSHLISALCLPMYRGPSVWYVHDRLTDEYLGRANRKISSLLMRIPKAVVANSRATAATTGRDCFVAYPGLTNGQFRTSSEVEARGMRLPPLLVVLGRISPTKGQMQAIRALGPIRDKYPEARLRIVGSPLFGGEEYEHECRSLVSDLGLESVVDFAGQVGDPTQELDCATVLIHASELAEPFGQVVTEAMARGVPVIATDAGGIPEILTEGGTKFGRLVPPSSDSAIAEAVIDLLENPQEAVIRARAAYRRASRLFTIDKTVEVMLEAWEWAMGRDDLRIGNPGGNCKQLSGLSRRNEESG